jgi:hypothetical protein
MSKLTEAELCTLAAAQLSSERWIALTEVKGGSTWFGSLARFDMVAIRKSWTEPCIRIYEAKVSRQSFLNDHKWHRYLPYCNEFYWLCPTGLIKRSEIADRCGLATFNPKSGSLSTSKKAIYHPMDEESRSNMLMYLFMWRIGAEDTREGRVKRIRQEMEENREVGASYREFVSEKLNEANERIRKEQDELRHREWPVQRFEALCEKVGIEPGAAIDAIRLNDRLEKLAAGTPRGVEFTLKNLLHSAKQATETITGILELLEENDD